MSKLEAGVGVSMLENSLEAGREAARQAIFKMNGVPQVLVVFAAKRFNHRKLLDGISVETGNVPMVGGTTAGEISSNGFSTQSVVVLAMRSEKLSFTTGIGLNMSNNEIACSKNLVQNLREKNRWKNQK
ncbi:MAG: hypothetical protein JW731_08885 [Bacteroidales bacterium]|nr:hypothetical protein [Bacteroidales bacterium]